MLKLDQISPNPFQPRTCFDEEALGELAQSIAQNGVIQPIVVCRTENPEKFTLVAGERRLRAAKQLGLGAIPVVVREAAPYQDLQIALVENLQRADLNCIEEAKALDLLITSAGLTHEDCAKKVGRHRASITNALRLLTLPPGVQKFLSDGSLSLGHGKALLTLEDESQVVFASEVVVEKGLSVRQTEVLCKSLKEPHSAAPLPGGSDKERSLGEISYLSDLLRSLLQCKVKLTGSQKKGRIEISFFSGEELERLIECFKKIDNSRVVG